MKNYTEVHSEHIDDIHSDIKIYRHDKTGARICTIINDDPNKVFTIGFRTPAINSTGLTHILEHSVLCGSKKYPLKDPFLELIKGSLNTFLNAFTYPDRTVYPCASQNDTDFKNLMSVYADAVFYPNIYKKEEIFHQEGWRYELFNKDDPIVYNGVVYNEMKGAFSSPDQIMGRVMLKELFPDTCYRFESGGDPEDIPSLSYEEFINFHKKYYSPSNAFIYLYGNCDMEERMKWLDDNYLSKFEKVDFDTEVKKQKPFSALREKTILYPISQEEKPEHKSKITYAFAFDNITDEEKMACCILDDMLINDPGAPLKKALLDAKVGSSVELQSDSSLVQGFDALVIQDTDPEKKDQILKVFQETIKDILKAGLDKESIVSHLNNTEFKVREGKFAYYPRGLSYILSSFETWLYDDNDATGNLKILPIISQLRKDLDKGIFERVLEKFYLNNKFACLVTLVPDKNVQQAKEEATKKKLADYKKTLSPKQIDELIKRSEDLRAYQAAPSTKEEIDSLPKLSQEDLKKSQIIDYKSTLVNKDFPVYKQIGKTNGITYGGFFFKTSDIPNELIPYAQLFTSLLGKLNTTKHTSSKLNSALLSNLGDYGFGYAKVSNKDAHLLQTEVRSTFSYLQGNSQKAFSLIEEILLDTDFNDIQHLYEVICFRKNSLQSGMSYNGHVVALQRAMSHVTATGYFNDMTGGIAYLDFLTDLSANFMKDPKPVVAKLEQVRSIIISSDRLFGYYTGEEANFACYEKEGKAFLDRLHASAPYQGHFKYEPDFKNEGIKAPFDVDYVARCGVLDKKPEQYGQVMTMMNILANDYLWMQIRVKGGAYGAMSDISRSGVFYLVSYRDPNLKETNQVYEELPAFIDKIAYSPDELMKFKIGALGSLLPVLHVSDQGFAGYMNKVYGTTYEDRLRIKDELINTTLEEVKSYAPVIKAALAKMPLCVFGNGAKIDENKDKFDTIRNLVKE